MLWLVLTIIVLALACLLLWSLMQSFRRRAIEAEQTINQVNELREKVQSIQDQAKEKIDAVRADAQTAILPPNTPADDVAGALLGRFGLRDDDGADIPRAVSPRVCSADPATADTGTDTARP
jgi:type II secretory pathway pseudopilin PulG